MMDMKKIGSKFMAGTLAAAILVGGGIVGLTQTQAAESGAAVDGQKTHSMAGKQWGPGGRDHGKRSMEGRPGLDIMVESAKLFGIEQKALMEELKTSKTLSQIAQEKGLTEDAFLEKLAAAAAVQLDAAVTAGKLTQEQADKQKSGLSDRLKDMVTRAGKGREGGPGSPGRGFEGGHGPGMTGFGPMGIGMMGFGPMGGEAVTSLLGLTKEELQAKQKEGMSLSEIAAEKGIAEDQLIAKIKDGMTEQIKKMVQMKRTPRDEKWGKKAPAAGQNSTSEQSAN
jgi:predicted transcriptional regulator